MTDDAAIDLEAVARDIDALDGSQQRLTEHLQAMAGVDPATPTDLPEWTLGHVMTHIARNADSTIRMLAGLPQYWKGVVESSVVLPGVLGSLFCLLFNLHHHFYRIGVRSFLRREFQRWRSAVREG